MQEDRIDGLVAGWGYGEEMWLIDHVVRFGNAMRTDVLQNVREMFSETYRKTNGAVMTAFLGGIDAAPYFDEVRELCSGKWKTKLIPTKGDRAIGKPIIAGRSRSRRARGTYETMVCTNSAKDVIYARYRKELPGPGYIHIPQRDCFTEDFLKQMVSERKVEQGDQMRWRQINESLPNEGLDLVVGNLVICMVAQQRFGFKFVPPEDFDDAVGENTAKITTKAEKFAQLAESWGS